MASTIEDLEAAVQLSEKARARRARTLPFSLGEPAAEAHIRPVSRKPGIGMTRFPQGQSESGLLHNDLLPQDKN